MLTEEQQDLIRKRYRIPCTSFVPDTFYIISFDHRSIMPTELELRQLDSYRECTVKGFYHDWLAEEILAKSLPAEAGHNTVIFAKGEEAWRSAGNGWAFRRLTWRDGPVYWPHMDTPKRHDYALVEIMDHSKEIGEKGDPEWEDWKRDRPEIFPPAKPA